MEKYDALYEINERLMAAVKEVDKCYAFIVELEGDDRAAVKEDVELLRRQITRTQRYILSR